MEDLMNKASQFLQVSYGYGYGYGYGDGSGSGSGSGSGDGSGYGSGSGSGSGYGSGDGSGYGYGYGYGDGYGYGYGDGSGDGSGDGNGIIIFNGKHVYKIDGIQTIIHSIKGNIARVSTINDDLTLTEGFVAKVGNSFAHGTTAREAYEEAIRKDMEEMPEEERLQRFVQQFPEINKKYPAKELFDWHGTVTHSCLFGRNQFVANKGIDINSDEFTIREFIDMTSGQYGGEIIKKLKELYQ